MTMEWGVDCFDNKLSRNDEKGGMTEWERGQKEEKKGVFREKIKKVSVFLRKSVEIF